MRRASLRPVLVALAVAGTLCGSGRAGVSVEKDPFPVFVDYLSNWVDTGVVLTPDGTPHALCSGPGMSLRHVWRAGGRWRAEVIDPPYAQCSLQPCAVDGLGRLHATWFAHPEEFFTRPTVKYGIRDESGWSVVELAPGRFPVIYLDADDLPRVVFEDGDRARVASFDGRDWSVGDFGPAPPNAIRPLRLIPDAGGHLHAIARNPLDDVEMYATDAPGSWTLEEGHAETLALGPDGCPHLITYLDSGVPEAWDRMVHRWFDGVEWRTEDMLDHGVPFRMRGFSHLVADPAGRLYCVYWHVEDRRTYDDISVRLAFRDGVGWRELTLGPGSSALPMPPALGPDGAVHVNLLWLYARVALPDLTMDAADLSVESDGEGARVGCSLRVRNLGAGRSKASRVWLYLSDDAVLDVYDEPFGPRAVPSLRPGGQFSFRVDRRLPGPVAGKTLLAAVHPRGRLPDLDRTNDVAAIPLE